MFTRRPNFDELAQSHGSAPPELPNSAPALPSHVSTSTRNKDVPVDNSSALAEGLVVIGKGTTVHGTIGDCRKLDIHGVLQGDVVAEMMIVREGGGIKGTVQTDRAEIHGVFEGTLIVHEHLQIEATGEVSGEISYQTFAMQTGARLSGNIVCNVAAAAAKAEADATENEQPSNLIKTDIWTVPNASTSAANN